VGREVTRAALLVLACVAALAAGACRRSGPDWRILQLYAGQRSAELLSKPAAVRAFPLDPVPSKSPGEVHAGPFAAAGEARDVPADAAAELSRIFSDAASYDWQRGPKREGFRPRVGLWFVRGSYVLELAVDVESAQVGVYAGGQTLGLQSVDPAAPALAAIAERVLGKQVLPPR
jgi:hypothetical protein